MPNHTTRAAPRAACFISSGAVATDPTAARPARRRAHTIIPSALIVLASLFSGCGVPQAEYNKLAARVVALEKQAKAPRVERIVIVDKAGKERAMFGMRKKDDTPTLRLKDESGTNRLLARLHPTGMPIFVMWGAGGKGTSYLSVPGEGPPSMMFFNKKGDQVFKAPQPRPQGRRR